LADVAYDVAHSLLTHLV